MTLEIRPVPDADLHAYFDLMNDEGLARNAGTVPYPIDLDWTRERLRTRREGEARGEMKDRGFYEGDRLVASGGYFFRDDDLEIGYSVHRDARRRGLATKVAGLIVHMARQDRLAGPIVANHFTDNPASGRVLEKVGFTKTGIGVGTSMARDGEIESRRMELHGDVHVVMPVEGDYPALFKQQQDEEARRQAGASRVYDSVEDYKSSMEAAMAAGAVRRTILHEGQVAGYIAAFDRLGNREVSYWLGRDFWGRGIATRALAAFLDEKGTRNCALYARVAKDHPASARVLEKCGFTLAGEDSYYFDIRGETVEEYLYRHD